MEGGTRDHVRKFGVAAGNDFGVILKGGTSDRVDACTRSALGREPRRSPRQRLYDFDHYMYDSHRLRRNGS